MFHPSINKVERITYAKQRLREMVEQLAQRGAPDVTNLIEHDRDVVWPMQRAVGGSRRATVIGLP
jgi:hypothetical protein